MSTRQVKLIILTLFIATIVLTGCATTNKPISGVVGWTKEISVGSPAPDIPFISMEGKQRKLSTIRKPITILEFTSTPGVACCRLEPELITLADRLKKYPITIVQISLPTNECSHGPGCNEICNINDTHLVSLCDAERIAWRIYRQPKPNTVLLIDENGKISEIDSKDNLESITDKAQKLAEDLYAIEDLIYDEG